MKDELRMLYKVKAGLAKDFEAATAVMPEKKALDQIIGLIATLENQQPHSASESDKVICLPNKKPRTLVSDKEKKTILDWLHQYFRMKNNHPVGFRQLTDLMLADGIRIPGPPHKQLFVVSGLVTRNKMFKGKNGLWHLAAFAA